MKTLTIKTHKNCVTYRYDAITKEYHYYYNGNYIVSSDGLAKSEWICAYIEKHWSRYINILIEGGCIE